MNNQAKQANCATIAVRCAESERPVWEAAVASLNASLQGSHDFTLAWTDDRDQAARSEAEVICLSLWPDLLRAEVDEPALDAEWRGVAAALRDGAIARGATVFVVTIFRCLSPDDVPLLPRLRRLNLLAARLSQEFGLFVIDIDRVMAHRGALELGLDARLGSPQAQDEAVFAIVDTLLDVGLGHLVEDEALQRAVTYHRQRRTLDRSEQPVPLYLERSRVKSREQLCLLEKRMIDDRGVSGLLRDLRAGRIGTVQLMREVAGKVGNRLARRRA
jgi:hypothetical protein